jgi:hypothetical protein
MFSYWWSKFLSWSINHQITNGLSLLCDQMVVIIELVPTLQVCICLNGCKLTSTSFFIISKTLANLINNYFGGYYEKKWLKHRFDFALTYPHWINEPTLCQLPCLLGMVDKVLQLSLEFQTCCLITLLYELNVNLCQHVDQLVFE